jgi:hypothetical protein
MSLDLVSLLRGICSTRLIGVIVLTVGTSLSARSGTITIDELGNGDLDGKPLVATFTNNFLSYQLPFNVTSGFVLLTDNGVPDDLIQFRGRNVFLYSDSGDGVDSAADKAWPKYKTHLSFEEDMPGDGSETVTYTPQSGQPGFNRRQNLDYQFISDAPGADSREPESLFLAAGALSGLALRKMLLQPSKASIPRAVKVSLSPALTKTAL